MNVLVAGGAGYIGSHTVKRLKEAGHKPGSYEEGARSQLAVSDIVKVLQRMSICAGRRSQMTVAQIRGDITKSNPEFKVAALGYFNASGCAMDGSLGEDHDPETHLIPVVLQAIMGLRPGITVFGTDYPTKDGTNIRDYIHVDDLPDAHIAAMSRRKEV